MRITLLLAAGALLFTASPALAVELPPVELPIDPATLDPIEILIDLQHGVEACAAGVVQGNASVGVDTTQTPPVVLGAPTVTPPTPTCLGVTP